VHELGVDLSAERQTLIALRQSVAEREARVTDLEMQIRELRAHLGEAESASRAARTAAQEKLGAAGTEIEALSGRAAHVTDALAKLLEGVQGEPLFDLEERRGKSRQRSPT
jgi:predicted  nucleic acid-binding Zn-ribbon protein